jgi:ABC-type bacteriocin/lantibiotic exporter with double-glycine peptidase domain
LPLFTGLLVDRVLPRPAVDVMTILGIGIAAFLLAQLVAGYLRAVLLVHLQARLDAQLMLGLFERVLSLPLLFFQQRTSGDLLMRLGSSTSIREMLTNQTLASVLDGGLVLGYLAILLVWDPCYGLVVVGIGALQVALMLGTSRRLQGLVGSELAAQAQTQSYLIEALKGIAALKASGAEQRAFDRWARLYARQLRVSVQRSHLAGVVDTVTTTLRTFSPLILLWIGVQRVLDGGLSLGTMLALNALAASFLAPLASIVSSGQQLQLAGAHLDRLADVLEAEPEQDSRSVRPAPRLTGRIELKQVSFRYGPSAPFVLRDVSLKIEPGQKVALVGRSGSGKSTLAMLLLGLYLPTNGEILYDGVPLQTLDLRTLRSQLGVVLQDPLLFSASIRQNVAFNDSSLPLDQVEQAARLAAIHDEIARMGMGYETLLAEGGAGLSGGQRQRLSIARALAHQPAILLLDEATSHLDVVTERVLDQQLSNLRSTRIVIAHRLSTVQNADLIVVVADGAVVEQGTHQGLLALGGHYAALLSGQLGPARSGQRRRLACETAEAHCSPAVVRAATTSPA